MGRCDVHICVDIYVYTCLVVNRLAITSLCVRVNLSFPFCLLSRHTHTHTHARPYKCTGYNNLHVPQRRIFFCTIADNTYAHAIMRWRNKIGRGTTCQNVMAVCELGDWQCLEFKPCHEVRLPFGGRCVANQVGADSFYISEISQSFLHKLTVT